MTSHMERTKKCLKERDIPHEVVERWFPRSKAYPFGCRKDLFNIIDLIALEHGIVGIQVCGTDWVPHYKKIMKDHKDQTLAWLGNGARIEVWGWRKLKKKRGGKAVYWSPRIADVLIVNGELYWEERG